MGSDHVCPMCWFSFDTEDELNQHIAMENEVEWTIDGAFDDDELVSHP